MKFLLLSLVVMVAFSSSSADALNTYVDWYEATSGGKNMGCGGGDHILVEGIDADTCFHTCMDDFPDFCQFFSWGHKDADANKHTQCYIGVNIVNPPGFFLFLEVFCVCVFFFLRLFLKFLL